MPARRSPPLRSVSGSSTAISDGHDTSWLTRPGQGSVRRYVFDVFVNGTHPLLPWFAFLCAGIVLGRVLAASWWRPAATAVGVVLVSVSALLSAGLVDRTPTGRAVARPARPQPRLRRRAHWARRCSPMSPSTGSPNGFPWRPTHSDEQDSSRCRCTLRTSWSSTWSSTGSGGSSRPERMWRCCSPRGSGCRPCWSAMAWQRRFGRGPAEYVYRAFGG